MPTGEPIEELSVRIVADASGLLEGTDEAIKKVELSLEELAEKAKDVGIATTWGNIQLAAKNLAETMDVDVLTAFEKMGEVAGAAGTNVSQLAHQMNLQTEAIKEAKIEEEKFAKQVEKTEKERRKQVATTKEAKQATDEMTESQKKSAQASREQEKEGSRVGKMLGNLAKRALVGIGVYSIAQRVWSAFTGVLKESVNLIIEAGDKTSVFIVRLKELRQESEGVQLALGAVLLPLKVFTEQLKVTAQKELFIITFHLNRLAKEVIPPVVASFAAFSVLIEGLIKNLQSLGQTMVFTSSLAEGLADSLSDEDIEREWKSVTEIMEEANQAYATTLDEMQAKTDEFFGDLSDTFMDIVDLIRNRFIKSIDDLKSAFDKAVKDIGKSAAERLEDITKRFNRRRVDAEIDLLRDLADIDQDAENDKINALLDYQLREFRIREDFKIRLLDLENRYILDLEDAVRERDARGVLMLQRRFNLEKAKLNSEKNLRLKRMKEDFNLELREIERQRRIRRAQRIIAFEEQLQDLAVQEERAREDARLQVMRRIRDLEIGLKERLRTLAEAFVEEYNLTAEQLTRLYSLLEDYYGADGYIQALFEYIEGFIAQVDLTPTVRPPTLAFPSDPETKLHHDPKKIIRPDDPAHGLAAPARVDRMSGESLSPASSSPAGGFGGGGGRGGRLQLDLNVLADPRLIVEVVNKSMNEIADVFVQVNRSRGGR